MGSKGSKKHDNKHSTDGAYITETQQASMTGQSMIPGQTTMQSQSTIPGMTTQIPGQMPSAQMNTGSTIEGAMNQAVPGMMTQTTKEVPGTITSTIPGTMPGTIQNDISPNSYTTMSGQQINKNPDLNNY